MKFSRPAYIFLTVTWLAVFCIAAWISDNEPTIGLSNWMVPDGLAVHQVLVFMRAHDFQSGLQILPEQFEGIPINPGLFLYYYPFVVALGSIGYFVGNCFCLAISVRRHWTPIFALLPYFLISISLPSKDILVLCLSGFLIDSLQRKSASLAVLWTVLTFFVRDGAGLIAFAVCLCHFSVALFRMRAITVLALCLATAALINYIILEQFGDLFIVSRNLSLAESAGRSELAAGSSTSYFLRLFGNATNLAFRPTFFDTRGNLALLSLSYWISGVSCLVAMYFAAIRMRFFPRGMVQNLVPVSYFASLIFLSLNPLVQPRYQLPFVALVLVQVFSRETSKRIAAAYGIATLISLLAAVSYSATGIGLPDAYEVGEPLHSTTKY